MILITVFRIFAYCISQEDSTCTKPSNNGGTSKHYFKWSLCSHCRWDYCHCPIHCHFLKGQFRVYFYFCIKSLTCFLVVQHHCCCLDRVLQTSAVGLHFPSSHSLVSNCTRVKEKENDLSGIYLAQQNEGFVGRGSGGAAAHNSKGKPWESQCETCHSHFLSPIQAESQTETLSLFTVWLYFLKCSLQFFHNLLFKIVYPELCDFGK